MVELDSINGASILDQLVDQIQAMETELAEVKQSIDISRSRQSKEQNPLLDEAKQLDAEANTYKTSVPDLASKDTGVSYFLAVGALEKEISDLKDYDKHLDRRITVNNDIINELNQDEKESQQVIDKLEKLVSEKVAADDTEASKTVLEKRKAEANLTLENKVRQTQLVTRQLKLFLKEYINKIGTQEEGIEEDKVPLGVLLQKLWGEFNTNDTAGWIHIQDLEFDVREQDVAKLLQCQVIRQRKEDDAIQLVDFTMRY